MKTGRIGPTMVVAIPLKTKPTKSTASKAVRLPVRSGIATVVVADMLSNILKEQAARGKFHSSHGSCVAREIV
jgi:hypothetical protein